MKREKNNSGNRILADPPAEPKPKREIDTLEWLTVRYTTSERLDLAERLARCQASIEQTEDQKKATDAQHKDLIARLELERKSLSRKLTAGGEMRNVECKWLLEDPTAREKTLVRIDTGEVVRTVPMIGSDFQEEIPIPPGELAGDALVLENTPAAEGTEVKPQ